MPKRDIVFGRIYHKFQDGDANFQCRVRQLKRYRDTAGITVIAATIFADINYQVLYVPLFYFGESQRLSV